MRRRPSSTRLALLAALLRGVQASNTYDPCNRAGASGPVAKVRFGGPSLRLGWASAPPRHGRAGARSTAAACSVRARLLLCAAVVALEGRFAALPLSHSSAQLSGGQPIGLAFWINGLLSDWDPVVPVTDNKTNVTTLVSKALHPCTDAAYLATVTAPAGVQSNGTLPAVRAPGGAGLPAVSRLSGRSSGRQSFSP